MIRTRLLAASPLVIAAALLDITASPAFAQSDQAAPAAAVSSETGVKDIVVTAEKRNSSLQRTPVAVTPLAGDALADQQVRSIADVQGLVPNFQFGAAQGTANIFLRGVGVTSLNPTTEGSVAVNLNDVYVSRPISQLTGFYDVSNIEVLRGPQGTLYGRNATAGSINIRTNMPTNEWSGYARLTGGNYSTVNTEAAISGPIIKDKLLFRIAVLSEDHSGYGKNIVTGHDIDDKKSRAIRGTLVAKPASNFTATVIAEYYHEKDASGGLHYFGPTGESGLPGQSGLAPLFLVRGGYNATNILDEASDIDPRYYIATYAITGTMEWKPTESLSLKSITGYRDQKTNVFTTAGGGGHPTTAYYTYGEPANQVSQELQANYDKGPIELTAGLYYFHENDTANPSDLLYSNYLYGGSGDQFIRFLSFRGTIRTDSKAAYAQGTYHLTDKLSLTAGIRYSHDDKSFSQQRQLSTTLVYSPDAPVTNLGTRYAQFGSWTPKFGIQYQVTPTTLLYATYAKGFRAGGFDISSTAPALQPEKLTDYEGGIKTTFFDRRLRLNLAGFYYDYTNLQIQTSNGTNFILINAGSAKLYGAEAEISALPIPALEIDASAAYLHTRFGTYYSTDPARPNLPPLGGVGGLNTVNFEGNRLPNAPSFSAHVSAEYNFELPRGKLGLRGEVNYTSKFYLNPNNVYFQSQGAYAKGNAFLTYRDDKGWSVGAYVRNISNKITIITSNVANTFGSVNSGTVSAPRTYGIEVTERF